MIKFLFDSFKFFLYLKVKAKPKILPQVHSFVILTFSMFRHASVKDLYISFVKLLNVSLFDFMFGSKI